MAAGAPAPAWPARPCAASDDADAVAPGYDTAPTWQGLGLVDFAIVTHFASAHAEL